MAVLERAFDPVAFGARLAGKIEQHGLSLREAQEACGVDHSIIHRVMSGKPPSVENYVRLARWLDAT